jgi:glycosyltransferase involved in cell wall biosynthesis
MNCSTMNYRKLIILPIYNQERFLKKSIPLLKNINSDVLLIDDGSTDHTYDVITEYSWLMYIKHSQKLGSGASFITAYEYARDLNYDVIISLDHRNIRYAEEISQLMDNISYGYDIVNSSRILENFNYHHIPQHHIDATAELSGTINILTGFDLTDPLSGIKALRTESLKNMELTEFNHGLYLQIWIQAFYFGLNIIEIPAQSGIGFGEELRMYNDPLNLFLSILHSEKCLYNKNSIN